MEIEEYTSRTETWVFRDEPGSVTQSEHFDFHIKTGDYFLLLSTVLGFVEETLQTCTSDINPELIPQEIAALKDARKDLAYLHENYTITPKQHSL